MNPKENTKTLSASIINNICKQWVDEEDDKREGDKDKEELEKGPSAGLSERPAELNPKVMFLIHTTQRRIKSGE